MSSKPNTFRSLIGQLSSLFEELLFYIEDHPIEGVIAYFREENKIDLLEFFEIEELTKIEPTLQRIAGLLSNFTSQTNSAKTDLGFIEFLKLAADFGEILENIDEIKKITPRAGMSINLAILLIESRVSKFLRDTYPLLFSGLRLLGLVSLNENNVNWTKLKDFLKDPFSYVKSAYSWDVEEFDSDLLQDNLYDFLSEFGIKPRFTYADDDLKNLVSNTSLDLEGQNELRIPIVKYANETGLLTNFGLKVVAYNYLDSFQSNLGLSIYALGELSKKLTFGNNWSLNIESDLDLSNLFLLEISSKGHKFIQASIGEVLEAGLRLSLDKGGDQDKEDTLLLDLFGMQLVTSTISTVFDFSFDNGEIDVELIQRLNGAKFILGSEHADGFLQKILPAKNPINFDFGIGYSLTKGFFFEGGVALEIDIPNQKTIGPVKFSNIKLKALPVQEGLNLEVSTQFETSLGIIQVSVANTGLNGLIEVIDFPNGRNGNLGPMDLDLGFKLPNKLSLKIDSVAIQGGGFLEFDFENHRYAGILAISFLELELVAIGLITTRLPNNKKGFSMLVSISVVFTPAIQLSFGFTLNGVGGLLGINRSMQVEELKKRISSGAVNAIMFPDDPIKNADKIISNLRAVFPPTEKHYLIAPFLKLGWGVPTLIEVDLGVFIEIPFQGRIILLGSLGIALPEPTKPLISINVDMVGELNFSDKYISINGALRDSKIVNIKLTGEFAFLLDYGPRPAFLLSVGGYHPRYKKPSRFPDIKRLTARLEKKIGKAEIDLMCEYYQAITSNSFQIGFRADLHAKYKKARVDAGFSFNALLLFDPLYFEVELGLNVKVRYKKKKLAGVELYFLLSGPSPWLVYGKAKVEIAFINFDVKFRLEWGAKQKEIPLKIPTNELNQKMEKQLQAAGNWAAKLPENFRSLEGLRPAEEISKEGIVLHPAGFLEVRQNLLPFDYGIDKMGNAQTEDILVYSLGEMELFPEEEEEENEETNSRSLVIHDRVMTKRLSSQHKLQENFGIGQYTELSDEEKLKKEDFQLLNAGARFGLEEGYDWAEDIASDPGGYEEIIIYSDNKKEDLGFVEKASEVDQILSGKNNIRNRVFRNQTKRGYQMVDSLPEMEPRLV